MSGEHGQEAQSHRPAAGPGAQAGAGGPRPGLHPQRLRGEAPLPPGPQRQPEGDFLVKILREN